MSAQEITWLTRKMKNLTLRSRDRSCAQTLLSGINAVTRFFMRWGEYRQEIMGSLSVLALAYHTHCVLYFISTSLVTNQYVLHNAFSLTKFANMAFIFVVIVIGVPFRHLVTRFIRWVKGIGETYKVWRYIGTVIGHLIRYFTGACFAIGSAWLGLTAQKTELYMRMLESFVALMLMVSMTLWSAEDFSALDSVLAVILGLIVSKKDGDVVTHMALAAFIPSIRHLIIPMAGFFLKHG